MPHLCLPLCSPHAANRAWPCAATAENLAGPPPLSTAQSFSRACFRSPLPEPSQGRCVFRPSREGRSPSANGRQTRAGRALRCSAEARSGSGSVASRAAASSGGGSDIVGGHSREATGGAAATTAAAEPAAAETQPPRNSRRRSGSSSRSSSSNSSSASLPPLPTVVDIEAAAAARGVRLEIQTTGPLFTISAYDASGAYNDDRPSGAQQGAGGGEGKPRLLGRAQGCIRPLLWGVSGSSRSDSGEGSSSSSSGGGGGGGGKACVFPPAPLLHLDSVRMARIEDERQRGVFGAALLIGALVFRWAMDVHGCKVAQLLAIDDSDEYHAKLVRYYSRLGMRAVRVVEGGSLGDVPHMLVWGGAGTLMEGEIEPLLRRWARVFPSAAATAAVKS